MKTKILVLVALITLAWGCQKEEFVSVSDMNALKSAPASTSSTYPLIAGQNTVIGNVEVSNSNGILTVTYNSSVAMSEFHLYVLANCATSRLTPGKAPFKSGILATPVYTYTFDVVLADLPFSTACETEICLQAHAVAGTETAYAGTIVKPSKGSWYGNMKYTIKCGDVPPPACKAETAWSAGSSYNDKGNWATYTAYNGSTTTVNLWAGQHNLAGTVTFSAPVNGEVTITINFASGWSLQNVDEPLKVQDYDSAPSGKTSPGQFDHKTNTTVLVVPANNFYGVHADVQKCS
jgi:hypothetical protein